VRVLADGQTDRHTHRHTDANRFYNLSHAICYGYGTDKYSVIFVSDALGISTVSLTNDVTCVFSAFVDRTSIMTISSKISKQN